MAKRKVKPGLPRNIKIGPMTFRITIDKAEYLEYSSDHQHPGAYGYMDYKSGRILGDPDQCDDSLADTMLHEMKHVVWAQAGGTELYDSELEEKIIMMTTTGELNTLRENPKFVEYIMGRHFCDCKTTGRTERPREVEPD